MMTKEGSTKVINFMTPGAGLLVLGRGHIVKICIRQITYIGMMTKERSTKILNIMTPEAGFLC